MKPFERKAIAALQGDRAGHGEGLSRNIGLFALTCFGVGSTVGAGIFVLTGTVAAQHSGPAVALSFLIASVVCLLAGLCYAELAAMMPVTGSAYSYSHASMGEAAAWMVGWCLLLEYLFSGTLVAIGWSAYFQSALHDLGVGLPALFTQAPFALSPHRNLVATGAIVDLPAVLLTLFCTTLLLRGTEFSARVNNIIVVAKIGAMLLVVVTGFAFVDRANWTPFIPDNTGVFGRFGWSGVMQGAGVLFFAYVGFDAVSTLAQEVRNPQRTVPRALLASVGVTTLLYMLVGLVITGLVSYRLLDVADPVYVALNSVGAGLVWTKVIVGFVAIAGLISVLLVTLLGQVRIFYAMGRDGLLPAAFTRVRAASHTPQIGTLVTGAIAALAAGLLPLSLLGELISIGTLFVFVTVAVSVIILRRREPQAARPFRVPLYPWTPVLSIAACLYLMWTLPGDTWVRLLFWLVIGGAVYILYGLRRRRRMG
ncbi:amino acid permease [Sphingomonas alpina]|uniref:Amino acid permease n=1 Tax=Sphingomonas alpina TaxID=653931 RepID=A0A7H0LDJ1_9SPHN|nr:amino acid permease [Sphingomonas alpina]QNQ07744.1 amino acid permease [Sphingomonas alpina]